MEKAVNYDFSVSITANCPIKESSFVTVTKDKRTKINNIDSLLVQPILNFLISFSIKAEEFNAISFFRGFKPNFKLRKQLEISPARFFELFFVVGEKGNAYREDVGIKGIKPYFDRPATIEDVKALLNKVNSILKMKDFGSICVEDLLEAVDEDVQNAYIFLLNLAHNIGGRWEDKVRSPFVSAAHGENGFDTALKFANSRNENDFSYVIWGFIPESRKHNIILTKELTKDIQSLNADWYEDIHSEIIIKDGIFPSNILGVFEIHRESGRKKFIINPYLYQLFDIDKEDSSEHIGEIFQYVCTNGIPIDQKHFSEFAKQLGYVSRGLDKHDGKIRAGRIGSSADIILPREYHFSIKEEPND